LWDFKYSQLICDNKSMRGVGQIALDMEQVYVDKILRGLRQMPNVKTYGALVDCIFYTNLGFDNPVYDFVDKHTFPSGKTRFKIKHEEAYKVPRHPLANQERSMKLEQLKPWKKLYEDSNVDHVEALRNFVQALRENQGGMILGPGGVGKTELIKHLVRSLKADKVKVHVCAVRHAAKALLPNGKTLAHLLHKYKDAREFWIIIDESSEIPLSMWADIAKWKFVGVYFVIVGDFAGQLCPISDHWKDAMDGRGIQDSDFMHSLVNGMQIHLTTCRRCAEDLPHFALTQSLYRKAFYKPGEPVDQDLFDKELRATLAELRPKFPLPPGALADVTLTLSHWMRINVNTVKNDILKDGYAEKRWMPWDAEEKLQGFTMQPQSCWIWKGLEVMGCTRKNMGNAIVNGFSYMVTDFDDEKVQLKVITKVEAEEEHKDEEEAFADDEADEDEDDEVEEAVDPGVFKVTHEIFMKHFRLAFAIPVCYAQGRTYRDKTVLLVDTESQHYSMRHLIVAVSRVTNSKNLWIAPEGYGYTIAAAAKAIERAREQWQRPSSAATMEVDDVQNLAYINRRSEAEDAADARMMELLMEQDDA
jgi:energy-coupling factor transporter ATP-binding protein EcfA2